MDKAMTGRNEQQAHLGLPRRSGRAGSGNAIRRPADGFKSVRNSLSVRHRSAPALQRVRLPCHAVHPARAGEGCLLEQAATPNFIT